MAALALTASACGGGGGTTTTASPGTTTASDTVQWAGGVCSAFTAWKTSLESIGSNVKGTQPSKSELRRALRQAENATQTLTRTLQRLGKPDTAAGQAAQKSLDRLSTQLSQGMDEIQQALKTASSSGAAGALAAVSTVSGTLSSMARNVSATVGRLKQLDGGSELEKAFHQAQSCSPYLKS